MPVYLPLGKFGQISLGPWGNRVGVRDGVMGRGKREEKGWIGRVISMGKGK